MSEEKPAYERIDESETFDGSTRDSHEIRYRMASQYIKAGDSVLDACCGVGYGMPILKRNAENISYIGIDRKPPQGKDFELFDFEMGVGTLREDIKFDVFVGLECIEHLTDAGVERLVGIAKMAEKFIIISTPIVRNANPYHKQQFSEADINDLFIDDSWELYEYFEQKKLYGIFIFKKS